MSSAEYWTHWGQCVSGTTTELSAGNARLGLVEGLLSSADRRRWDGPPPLPLPQWRAGMHTKPLNLLSGSADEYEWWCEYGWGGNINNDDAPHPHQLVMWGHWVEPINHCIANQMFGRQLFVLRVVLFKWVQIPRDCWPLLCCCLSLILDILHRFACTALECQNMSHNTA